MSGETEAFLNREFDGPMTDAKREEIAAAIVKAQQPQEHYMTLSPENKAIFDRLWRAEVEAGRSGDVSLNRLMDAARSEAKPIEVEEVANIIFDSVEPILAEMCEPTREDYFPAAQAILSKLQGGEGKQEVSSSQSQPVFEATRETLPSGGRDV